MLSTAHGRPQRALRTRERLLAAGFLALLAIATITRLTIAGLHPEWLRIASGGLVRAFALGFVNDLAAVGWALAPVALALSLLGDDLLARPLMRAALRLAAAVAIFAALFVAVAEFLFFAEFDSRFNFVATEYLLYPTEVSTNIWQSYPTGWILLALVAVTVALSWRGRALVALSVADPPPHQGRGRLARLGRRLAVPALLVMAAGGLGGLLPQQAHVADDRALNELAGNGYASFVRALLDADAPWEGLYPSYDAPTLRTRLAPLLTSTTASTPSFADGSPRRHVRGGDRERRLNVVVVLEESLGAEHVGTLTPRPESLTPQLDALADEGTLFTRAFATGNRTIRAIEATTLSIPPLPGAPVVRREASAGLFTLPSLLASRGYQTSFVYGGRALFDGMRDYFERNGIERIVDLPAMPDDAFTTAWGACDEAIFDRTLELMDELAANRRPFYTLVLTVSNHRPYTFPHDRFAPRDGLTRRENAVRYADHALGRFLRMARAHAFFDDTLFVLMGDHGARVYGAAEIPLPSYRVPILFLGPGIAAGRRIDTITSSLDVPPTILARLGWSYDSKFFGQDAFTVPADAGRALMLHNQEVALLRGDRLAVLGLHGEAHVYPMQGIEASARPLASLSPADREQLADTVTYFAAADRFWRSGHYGFDRRAAHDNRLAANEPPTPAAPAVLHQGGG